MQLRVILRLTPSENRKNRPDWYSKETSLRSLLVAIEHARAAHIDVTLLAVIDISSGQSLSPGTATLIEESADAVMPITGGTAGKSWRPVVRLVRDVVPFADDDLIYFIEDDYLHVPDALMTLVKGETEYRLLYAHERDHGKIDEPHNGWAHVPGGTSSFAVTGAAFRSDAPLHIFFSHGGGAWDELSWRALGSHATKPGVSYVTWPFTRASKWSRRWGLRPIRHAVFRALALAASCLRNRSISVTVPFKATHAEADLLAAGEDWAVQAEPYLRKGTDLQPELSIIVPSRNQCESLERTCDSLGDADPAAVEVLVIDACSTDGSSQLIHEHAELTPALRAVPLVAPCNESLMVALGRVLARGSKVRVVEPGSPIDGHSADPDLACTTSPRTAES